MLESIKRLFKHSVIYGIGNILSRSIGFLLLPIHTNVFERPELGVATVVFSYLAVALILYTYGLDAAFLRYFILEDKSDNKKQIFSTAYLSVFFTSIVFSGLVYFSAEQLSRHLFSTDSQQLGINLVMLIRLSSGILLFDALAFFPFLVLRAEELSHQFVLFKFLNVAINLTLNVVFIIILKFDITGIFWANLVSSILTFLLVLPITLKYFSFGLSKQYLRDLFAFGLPYIPSTLSVVLMDTIDRVLLERMAGPDVAGLYMAGAKLGMFMSLFVGAFRFAWHPYFLATSKQPDAKAVFARVFTYIIMACGLVFLFLSFFIDNIVRFSLFGKAIIGPKFWDSTVVVPLIMLAYVFYSAYLVFLIGIYLKNKTGYLPFITVLGLAINLALNFFLIPQIGMMGAAWARLVSYIVMTVALYLIGNRLYPITFEYLRLVKMVVVMTGLFALAQIPLPSFLLLYKIFLLIMLPIFLYLVKFFNHGELQKGRQLIGRFGGGIK